jgi:hypothetical protein
MQIGRRLSGSLRSSATTRSELIHTALFAKLQAAPHLSVTEIMAQLPASEPIGTPHVIATVASMTSRAASRLASFIRVRMSAAAARASFWRMPD